MNIDDIIYVVCLLSCIGVGNFVKKIDDGLNRRIVSTLLGLLVVVVVSGWHYLHCIFSVVLGAATAAYVHPSKCHLATFAVAFGYLLFFRLVSLFDIPDAPGHTNMIQMMLTLKLTGVAFEKNAAWKRLQLLIQQGKQYELKNTDILFDEDLQEITPLNIFHYCFNYVGVLTGPFYRYRTYRDYFDTSFRNFAPTVEPTIKKFKYATLFCALYLVSNYIWPLEYALSDEFYNDRSFIYRLMYVWPTFFIFRMRIYTGLTLSECVCTMAGFGAYPDEADVRSGEGPRKLYKHFGNSPGEHTYNYTTIVNTHVLDVERCITFREGMKHWNVCVQYWLAVNIYKLFPSKKYRTAATLLVSSYWHGFRPGHYFCLMGAPFYVPLEDMWGKLVRQDATGAMRWVIDAIFWIAKWFAFSYLGTAFLLSSFENIWRFYSSIYHIGYVSWAVMILLGIFLTKQKKGAERRQKKLEDATGASGDSSVPVEKKTT